jgi:hypothetical protein
MRAIGREGEGPASAEDGHDAIGAGADHRDQLGLVAALLETAGDLAAKGRLNA